MPTNKYGYLQRISNEESSEELKNEFSSEFQGGGETLDISFNYPVTPFASFEQDRFKLDNSKYESFFLANDPLEVNHVTVKQSNENGIFEVPISSIFSRRDGKTFSENGITFVVANYITSLQITAWSGNVTIIDKVLTDLDSTKTDLGYAKKQSFFVNIENADRAQITINAIDKPFNFFYLFNLNVGIYEEFKSDKLLSVTLENKFSVYGDSLDYSVLDFEFKKDGIDRGFTREEKIQVLKNIDGYFEPVQASFFTREVCDSENSVLVNCEDIVSFFETEFNGGVFENSSAGLAMEAILGEDLLPHCFISSSFYTTPLFGYLPPCTKREAIQQILLGCNARKYKYGGVDSFSEFKKSVNSFVYDKSKIIENPQIIKKQPLKELRVRTHRLAKSNESVVVYEGQSFMGDKLIFDKPFWALSVYRKTENGDLIAVEPNDFVTFDEISSNIITFKITSTFEIVVKAYEYRDTIVEKTRSNDNISRNRDYLTETVELSVYSDFDAVCDLLYELYSRPCSIKFKTLYEPVLGEAYNILGYILNIKSVKESLNGVYEVEAC